MITPHAILIRGGSGFDGPRDKGVLVVWDRLPPLTEVTTHFDEAVGAEAQTPSCVNHDVEADDEADDEADATRRGLFAARKRGAVGTADDQGEA